jgi:hypothetical protein
VPTVKITLHQENGDYLIKIKRYVKIIEEKRSKLMRTVKSKRC